MSDEATIVDPLRSHAAWAASIKNFAGWLGTAAPGGMDVDFLCERNGRFLVIEAKPWRSGVVLPYGQHKALYALSLEPNFRVYLAGEDSADEGVLHLARVDTAPKPEYLRKSREMLWPASSFIPTTKEQLSGLVAAWWKDAEE